MYLSLRHAKCIRLLVGIDAAYHINNILCLCQLLTRIGFLYVLYIFLLISKSY